MGEVPKSAWRLRQDSNSYAALRASLIKILPLEDCEEHSDGTILESVIDAKDATDVMDGIARTLIDLREKLASAFNICADLDSTNEEFARAIVEHCEPRCDAPRDHVDLANLRSAVIGHLELSSSTSTNYLCDEIQARTESAPGHVQSKYDDLLIRHEHALRSAYHLAALACDVTGLDARAIRKAADRVAVE